MDVGGLIERARRDPTTIADHLGPVEPPLGLADVAARIAGGADPVHAARDLLDTFQLASAEQRAAASVDRPPPTGDPRWDAWLGALAEHTALRDGLAPPPWSSDPDRFLDRFWFVSPTPGFRAVSIAQAPIAFKRRGIMVPERSLRRV